QCENESCDRCAECRAAATQPGKSSGTASGHCRHHCVRTVHGPRQAPGDQVMAHPHDCPGPIRFGSMGRRAFLQAGLAGFAALSLPGILKLRSASASAEANAEKKAVIMVWQPGGLSHLDSYDPKPDSGSEYRGPFGLIPTKVPGLQFTELLPRQA